MDCFKCASFNGSNPFCEDPFHNNRSDTYLESPCLAGWKARDGLFPSTDCIKLSGYFSDNHETMVVRGCSVDSGSLTVDTEMGRQSHCGVFIYEDRLVVGCLDACNEFDACNGTVASVVCSQGALTVVLFTFLLFNIPTKITVA
ncbi:uncharacterized protein LOC143027948 [Oratosquilla oratoria]|uniref:uncharacterized protein LOC143027948 n=1 Tax=Oratosquilla oratoria TaxID=337810 RepID=UPI003F76B279